jgi:hypothetical protein
MMTANSGAVIGIKGENLKEVLRVVGEVLDTSQVDKLSSQRLLEGLRLEMKKWEKLRSEAYGELAGLVKEKLNSYV